MKGTNWLGWLIALAMMLVNASVPASPAFAHPIVEHLVTLDDHGHSHDIDDVEFEPSGAHKPAHTGDHSHDVPSLPPFVNAGISGAVSEHGLHARADAPRNLPVILDRPPKLSADA